MASRGRGRGRGGDRAPLPRNVQISKKVSWLLRHGAESEGLKLGEGGFVNVQDVLNNRKIRSMKISFPEIRQIVEENDKQRFTMVPVSEASTSIEPNAESIEQPPVPSDDPKDWLIRANQGHSLKVDSEGLLQPITDLNIPETVIHGTNHVKWGLIVASNGLKPMRRNHVHFAAGLPSGFRSVKELDKESVSAPVISGMRNNSTILIFLDIRKAMDAGMKFWRSDNGVILSEGLDGLVPLDFFKRVEDRTGEGVLVEDGKVCMICQCGSRLRLEKSIILTFYCAYR